MEPKYQLTDADLDAILHAEHPPSHAARALAAPHFSVPAWASKVWPKIHELLERYGLPATRDGLAALRVALAAATIRPLLLKVALLSALDGIIAALPAAPTPAA